MALLFVLQISAVPTLHKSYRHPEPVKPPQPSSILRSGSLLDFSLIKTDLRERQMQRTAALQSQAAALRHQAASGLQTLAIPAQQAAQSALQNQTTGLQARPIHAQQAAQPTPQNQAMGLTQPAAFGVHTTSVRSNQTAFSAPHSLKTGLGDHSASLLLRPALSPTHPAVPQPLVGPNKVQPKQDATDMQPPQKAALKADDKPFLSLRDGRTLEVEAKWGRLAEKACSRQAFEEHVDSVYGTVLHKQTAHAAQLPNAGLLAKVGHAANAGLWSSYYDHLDACVFSHSPPCKLHTPMNS